VDTVHKCNRQTDRRTDRITITKTVQRIASHGKNEMISSVENYYVVIVIHNCYYCCYESVE